MVQRRRLRVQLRRARSDAGLTQPQVAEAMDWHVSKVIRIESGAVGISTNDLKALLRHYGIDKPEDVDQFIEMARASRESPWWSGYRDITSPQFQTLLGHEGSASGIYQFHPAVVPGLLQHEDYIKALLRGSAKPAASEQEIQKRFELRLRRQLELLDQPDPPAMDVLLDEAVLHRWIGGPEVMRRQLEHLLDLASRGNITIQVVPFSAGAHESMLQPFMILEFDDDDDVLFLENPRGSLLSRDNQDEVASYRQTFERLRELAADTDLNVMVEKALAGMSAQAA